MKKYIITLSLILAPLTLFPAKSYAEAALVTQTDTIYALCESIDLKKEICQLPSNTVSVTRITRYSSARCDEGTANFSYSNAKITVNNGCRAKYRVKLSSVVKVQTIDCYSNTGLNPTGLQTCSFELPEGYFGTPVGVIWKEHKVSKAACKGVGSDSNPGWYADENYTWGVLNYGDFDGFAQNTMYTSYGCRGRFSQVIE